MALNINPHFSKTELSDRTLWYDGESSYDPQRLISTIGQGYSVSWVDYMTQDIATYNNFARPDQRIGVKTCSEPLDMRWNIPDKYLNMDVVEYVINIHADITKNISTEEADQRDVRLYDELVKFEEMGLMDVLRTMVYITDVLRDKEVVYGVGRGSSVSSYVLYVIGVHDVDSFKYELDMNDFLHN